MVQILLYWLLFGHPKQKKYLDRIVIMPWTLSIWNHFVNKKLFWTQQHPKWFQVGFDGYWFQGKTYKSSFVYRSYNAFFALSRWWFELIATNQLKICFQTASIRYYVPNKAENVLSWVKKNTALKKVVSLFSVDSLFNIHLLIIFSLSKWKLIILWHNVDFFPSLPTDYCQIRYYLWSTYGLFLYFWHCFS